MADRTTCGACGHEDWSNEMYAVAGPGGAAMYCRNHNTCQDRRKARWTQQKETTMEFGTYTEPVQAAGDTYKPRDHYGNSAIVRVTEYKPSVVTPNSPNGAPAVIVDVYDLNNKAAYMDVLIMTGSLVDAFKPHAGLNPIVVKWEKAVAANGRDYAKAVPAVQAAIDAAKNVYAAGDPFLRIDTIGDSAEEEMPF